jgi:hypothetical protein
LALQQLRGDVKARLAMQLWGVRIRKYTHVVSESSEDMHILLQASMNLYAVFVLCWSTLFLLLRQDKTY